jgi:hypothetical protein
MSHAEMLIRQLLPRAGARQLLASLSRQPRASLTDGGDYSEPLPVSQDAVRLRTTLSALEDAAGGPTPTSGEVGGTMAFRSTLKGESSYCQGLIRCGDVCPSVMPRRKQHQGSR